MAMTVEVRPATTDDYQAVMDINKNVYDGMDYLPQRYMHYLRQTHRHLVVATTQGKVVGFLIRFVIDGGTVSVTQAVRTHPDYAGRGIFGEMSYQSYLMIKDRYPELKWTASTAVHTRSVESSLKKFPYQKLLGTRTFLAFSFENIKKVSGRLLPNDSGPSTMELPPKDAVHLLANIIDFKCLVPETMWVIDWEPYGHHIENYQTLVTESSVHVSRGLDDKVTAISFLTVVKVPAGWRGRGDFYCMPSEMDKPHILTSHVFSHFHNLKANLNDDKWISYKALFPKTYPGEESWNLVESALAITRDNPPAGSFYEDQMAYILKYKNDDYDNFKAMNH